MHHQHLVGDMMVEIVSHLEIEVQVVAAVPVVLEKTEHHLSLVKVVLVCNYPAHLEILHLPWVFLDLHQHTQMVILQVNTGSLVAAVVVEAVGHLLVMENQEQVAAVLISQIHSLEAAVVEETKMDKLAMALLILVVAVVVTMDLMD